jgi:hypothetical protein
MSGPERAALGDREACGDQPVQEPQGFTNGPLASERGRDGSSQWEGYDLAILDAVLDS